MIAWMSVSVLQYSGSLQQHKPHQFLISDFHTVHVARPYASTVGEIMKTIAHLALRTQIPTAPNGSASVVLNEKKQRMFFLFCFLLLRSSIVTALA